MYFVRETAVGDLLCASLVILPVYQDNIGKSNVFGTVAYSDEESAC